jgi:hypothetical protein
VVHIIRSTELVLEGAAGVPMGQAGFVFDSVSGTCVELASLASQPELKFQWTVMVGGGEGSLALLPELNWAAAINGAYAATAASPVLRIPPNSLIPGKQYVFVLTAHAPLDPSYRASGRVSVVAALEPLTAAIRGGSRVVATASETVLIAAATDPSDSRAPDGTRRTL